MIGDEGVGKSSLMLRYTDKTFDSFYEPTIGINFRPQILPIFDIRTKIVIVIQKQWDTEGQQRFRTIARSYYSGTNGVIIVFSKDSRESFENIENWIEEIDIYSIGNPIKIIVGNKSDLIEVVTTEEANIKANKYGFQYFESSAKNNFQVDEIFKTLTTRIVMKSNMNPSKIQLRNEIINRENSCC